MKVGKGGFWACEDAVARVNLYWTIRLKANPLCYISFLDVLTRVELAVFQADINHGGPLARTTSYARILLLASAVCIDRRNAKEQSSGSR